MNKKKQLVFEIRWMLVGTAQREEEKEQRVWNETLNKLIRYSTHR